MNIRNSAFCAVLFFLSTSFCTSLHAEVMIKGTGAIDDYWQCSAFDRESNQWLAKSQYELTATNKAFDACKKQSKYPQSCKAAKESCEAIVNGYSTRPMWQCTALDQTAKPWRSTFYVHRDDAALGAKAYCIDHSSMPDTCYINLLTCRNLNERT